MARLMQTYLGVTLDKDLCLVKPRKVVIEGEDWTAKLPDELLAEVFRYLAPEDWEERKSTHHILFMSRRWREFFEPFYYRCLDLGYEGYDKRVRLTRLLRTLRDRPEFCRHIRQIPIALWKAELPTCQLVSQVLTACSQARIISMHLNWTNTIPIIEKIPNFRRLERLDLSGYSGGPSLMTFSRVMELPMLKSLTLSRYGAGRPNEPGARWPEGVSASISYLNQILPPHRQRLGSITQLNLSDPSCSPEVSCLIAQWPTHLTEFNLTDVHHSHYGQEYTAGAIQRLVDPHQSSLKHIELGIFGSRNETSNPIFSHFISLETLLVSKFTFLRENPNIALAKIASPSLYTLHINFSPQDQHSESLSDFGPEQARWFADFAAAKAAHPQAGLKEVHVTYWPEIYPGCYLNPEDCPWPMEYMNKAQLALESHDLKMTFSSSVSGSKQAWIDSLKAHGEQEISEKEEDLRTAVENVEADLADVPEDFSDPSDLG